MVFNQEIIFNLNSGMDTALYKPQMVWYHSKKLRLIIHDILNKFWPYDILADGELEESLRKIYSIQLKAMILFSTAAMIYFIIALSEPLFFGTERTMPFPTMYFFDWSVSPAYQLVYAFQSFTFGLICVGILAMDFLLLTVCGCIVAQYRILQYSFLKFNTDDMLTINEKFAELGENKYLPYTQEKSFLVRCIKHHRLILRITRDMNECFSSTELLQLCSSMVGICNGMFQMTKGHWKTSENVLLGLYFFGNIIQLLIYCGIGNELKYQASILPQYIYLSNWNEATEEAKGDILFILAKSQEVSEMTTYNLYTMDLLLFLRVIKVSFSGYTLLSKLSET